jgi:tetratricopeptide (TPR) repeat protein
MSKIKVMVTLLTSGQKYWFNECWKSIKNQFPVNTIDYDVYFVVNTLNDGYWDDIKRTYTWAKIFNNPNDLPKDLTVGRNVFITRTESNGKPGKGHNSLLDLFKQQTQYNYLFAFDGDDMLYPCAFQRIENYLRYKPDIIGMMYHDIICGPTEKFDETIPNYPINKSCFLNFNFSDTMHKIWEEKKPSPFERPISNNDTALRLIVMSRNIFTKSTQEIRYDENMTLYDDYRTAMIAMEQCILGNLKVFRLADSNLYLYNKTPPISSTKKFNSDKSISITENKFFDESIKNQFCAIRDWPLYKIPVFKCNDPDNFTLEDKVEFCKKAISGITIEELTKEKYHKCLKNMADCIQTALTKKKWYIVITCAKRILEENVTNKDAYFMNLGVAYYHTDKHDLAVQNFKNALKINPNNFQSLKNLAIYYKSNNQPYLDYLKRAAAINSDDEFIKSEYKNINNNENSNDNILYKDLNGFLKI